MTPANLKRVRLRLGLTQSQLAARLGVASNTVTRWEMGLHPVSLMAEKLLRTLRSS